MNDVAKNLPAPVVKNAIDDLQRHCEKMPQVNVPLTHRFAPGLYYREIFIPKGTFIITHTHKTEHPFVIAAGKISVWTYEQGVTHITAPHSAVTKPGTRRLIFAHEDCSFFTFHPTTETDVDKLEDYLFEKLPKEPQIEAAIFTQLQEGK